MGNRRSAFTLLELLTVIAIMLVLSMMIVAVAYNGTNKQVSANGATAIVGWMKTAQAYALRDHKPYGVRFDLTSTHLVTNAQYVEQPDDWVGPLGSMLDSVSPDGGSVANITVNAASPPVDFTGGFGAASDPNLWPIQPGDYLEWGNILHPWVGQIKTVTQNTLTVTIWSPDAPAYNGNGWNVTKNNQWRIVRQPRTMIGSDTISLSAGAVIDTDVSFFAPPAPQYKTSLPISGSSLVVLFGPNGSVVGTPGMIRLWVRDGSLPAISPGVFQGEQFIVAINGATGLVGIQQVNVTAAGGFYSQPYSFTQDGKSSGY